MTDAYYSKELDRIAADGNLRRLMPVEHTGCEVVVDGRNLLNLSSNDYLGLGADRELRAEFIAALRPEDFSMTSSSSRLLSGDFPVCEEVESMLAGMFGKEAALAFNSGYHMNLGILPAVAGKDTLIVADKLVHASIIDGIRRHLWTKSDLTDFSRRYLARFALPGTDSHCSLTYHPLYIIAKAN